MRKATTLIQLSVAAHHTTLPTMQNSLHVPVHTVLVDVAVNVFLIVGQLCSKKENQTERMGH